MGGHGGPPQGLKPPQAVSPQIGEPRGAWQTALPPPPPLPAPPCRPPPSWPCTCRERSSARPGAGRRCRDQSSPPAGGRGGRAPSCSCRAAPPVHPHVPPQPAGGYRLRHKGCSGHHARERSVPRRPPALPPTLGQTRETGHAEQVSPVSPRGVTRQLCPEQWDTSPGHSWDSSSGCIPRAQLHACPPLVPEEAGGCWGPTATSPVPPLGTSPCGKVATPPHPPG